MRTAHFLVYQTGMFSRFTLFGLALAVLVASFAQVSLRTASAAERMDVAVCLKAAMPAALSDRACRAPEPAVADHTGCTMHKAACGLDLAWGHTATAGRTVMLRTGISSFSRFWPPSAPAERILRPPIRVS